MKKISYILLFVAVCFCGLDVQAKSVDGPVIPLGNPQHSAEGGDAFSRWVLGEPTARMMTTSVCINEIDSDTPGVDAAEFIELSGTPNGALDHFVVVLFNGANDLAYRVYDLDGLSLDANGFFLIGNVGVAGVDLVIPNNTIQNGADAVAIYDTSDFVILSFTTTIHLVDAIVYDTDDADDAGLLNGLGQSVQYNENQNGLAESQSISRSTDCGSTIVTQNITPNASNGMSSCPSFPGTPANVSITNSACNPSCVAAGGLITAPTGSPCPASSTLQYQVNGGSWSSTLPIYAQSGPAQSVKTRCSCDADNTMNSAESAAATTIPANCTDNTLPMITCPGNIAVANTTGLCSATVSYTTPVGTDNCTGATTIQTLGLASGASYPVGATTNIFKVTDASGNTATCAFAVSVTDTQKPTITCPGNIAVANTTGLCSAIVTYSTPVGTDNCSSPTTIQTSGLPSGASFPVGVTTNTFKVADGASNTATCAFAVSVTDTQLPTITCPANIAVANTSGLCSAIVSYTTPSGTDNCSGAATIQTAGLPSGASYPVGATTNIFKVTDGTGNTATCAFAVSVTDTQLPTITCPANIAVANASGLCSAIVSYTSPSGTDNCSGAATIQTAGLPSGASYPVGATTNIFKVTDGASNTATCAFTVTVNDTQAPIITCPANIAVNTDANLCSAVVNYTAPLGTDNCSGATTARTAGLASGSAFPRGVTTNTFTVTAGNSQTASCSFTVTVTDNQAPSIVCPANQNIPANASCSGTVGTWNPTSVSDNCGTVTVTQTPPPATALFGHNASAVMTLIANDGNGNASTCSFTVTLKDQTLPVAKCKNVTANLGANGIVIVAPVLVDNGSTDNCSFALTLTPNTFSCINIGLNSVTLRATDAGGNTATCTAKVTVKDLSGPTAMCKNPTIFLNSAGQATLSTAQVDNGSTDNCGIGTMSINKTLFNCSEISGTQPVNLSLTDLNGNTSSCLSNVTVKDAIAPTAICDDVTVQLNAMGKATVFGATLAVNSTDNCSVWSYSPIAKVYTAANLGANNLTITVKDWSGNSASCVSVVTVLPYIGLQQGPGLSVEDRGLDAKSLPFNVYPNPTTGDASVAFELRTVQAVMIRVFDLQGRMILQREDLGMEGENTLELRLEGVAPGVYMVDFQAGDLKVQRRLVVQD